MNVKNVCYVFGAGNHYGEPSVSDSDALVIAADGGYSYLAKHGLRVHRIVGDMDSLQDPPKDIPITKLPKEKDDTDMAAAVRYGMEAGYRVFCLYGGTGGRIDHTLANVQLLSDLARKGARGFLFDQYNVITAIHNSFISFPDTAAGYISVFAHSDSVVGVNERGLKYSIHNATLRNTCPIGISNEFVGRAGVVSVREGTLIVVYPADAHKNDFCM